MLTQKMAQKIKKKQYNEDNLQVESGKSIHHHLEYTKMVSNLFIFTLQYV